MNPPRTLVLRKLLCRRNSKHHYVFNNTFIMDIKMFKMIFKFENVLCIYRNYSLFTRKQRIIANIHTLFDLGLMIIAVSIKASTHLQHLETDTFTFLITIISSLTIIVAARWHNGAFKRFISCIDANHQRYIQDTTYLKNIEGRSKTRKLILICYVINSVIMICLKEKILSISTVIHYTWVVECNIRYILEYSVLYSLLFIMSEQVKCITRGIEENVQAIVGDTESGVDNNAVRGVRVDLDRFDKWTNAYTDVKESSNLFNAMFGVQITVMLVAAMLYFIIFLYGFAYISVINVVDSQYIPLALYTLKLLIYLAALFILSRSAQDLQNEVDALRRQLVKLLIHSPKADVSHKATKDLLRLVSIRAVRTRSFGSVNIDMTLIPYTVMFFTSYTVIALQLNNVV